MVMLSDDEPKKAQLLSAEAESNAVLLERAGVSVRQKKKSKLPMILTICLIPIIALALLFGAFWLNGRPTNIDRQNAENNLISIENASQDMVVVAKTYDFSSSNKATIENILTQFGEFNNVILISRDNLMGNRLLNNLPPDDIWQPFENYMKQVDQLSSSFGESVALILPVIAPTPELARARNPENVLIELNQIRQELENATIRDPKNLELRDDLVEGYDALISAMEDYNEALVAFNANRGRRPSLDDINKALLNIDNTVSGWLTFLLFETNFKQIRMDLVDYWN